MEMQEFIQNFAAQFDDEPANLEATSKFRDIEDWSSLVALSVIAMVDEEYGVKLTGDDVRGSVTVGDVYEIVKNKKQ